MVNQGELTLFVGVTWLLMFQSSGQYHKGNPNIKKMEKQKQN